MLGAAPIRLLAVAIALTGVFALAAPGTAMGAKPCWKQIVEDWYPDERIDGSYSQACYRQADENIPQDLRDYSDLPSEIARAKLRDLRDERSEQGERSLQGAGPVDSRSGGGGDAGGGDSSGGLVGNALDALGPDSADSAPIPLLVLAGLAFALVAAGAAGLLSRKLAARRAQSLPPDSPDV